MSTTTWRSSIGMIEIEIKDQSLLKLKKSNTKKEHIEGDSMTRKVIEELTEYLEGRREEFDLPVAMDGTPFQKAVWNGLLNIPSGETRTYGELAAMIGKPKAARAVGQALNKNPVCIVVPCHRVTSSAGLGGYAYGPDMKKRLLEIEQGRILA